MRPLLILLTLLFALSAAAPVFAAEKPLRVKPSKVSAAKGREREKQFTEWTPENEFKLLVDKKAKAGEQMIFFEYHEGKRAYRGIFSKAMNFRGWWWLTVYSEKDMEAEVNLYKQREMEPVFVVLERNFYTMLFVNSEQVDAARKLVLELGIEPPVIK